MILSENRYPPRITFGAGFFGIMLWSLQAHIGDISTARNIVGDGRFCPMALSAEDGLAMPGGESRQTLSTDGDAVAASQSRAQSRALIASSGIDSSCVSVVPQPAPGRSAAV
jgi:hypothetical protein